MRENIVPRSARGRRRFALTIIASVLLAMTALAPTFSASAQSTPSPTENIRTITVNGTGIVTVKPDVATITLGVQNQSKSLETAQDDNSTAAASVTKVFTDAGIDEKDIQTSGYSVFPIAKYDDNGNNVGITGYRVSLTISVTVRDITQVGTLLDSAVSAGANQVMGISFSVDDPSTPASQARQAAVEDARAKADELARAAGVVVTGVYSIQETSSPAPKAQDFSLADASAAPSMAREVPVNPGSADVQVDVQVVFEITPANG